MSYAKLPLSFEANQGQTDKSVKFLSHGRGYGLFLAGDEAVLTLRSSASVVRGRLSSRGGIHDGLPQTPNSEPRTPDAVLRMRLVGRNAIAAVTGGDELPGKVNYFLGNDPKKWRTNLPTYSQVRYRNVYPGIDLIYYGNKGGQLEYDFVVAPGADPNQIKLSFAGADGMGLETASGDLVLRVGDTEVRFQKPAVYQPSVEGVYDRRRSDATTQPDGAFLLAGNNDVSFRVAGYDPKRVLVIDPVLSYSTYLGGSAFDGGSGIAVDPSGNAYVTGYTESTDFPTDNPFQPNFGGQEDAFVAKLNASGSALVYSTYMGGSSLDGGWSIAVDATGNAYVTGYTESTDFPTANPFQPNFGGQEDAFVAKLNASGSALIYSTYLGGSSQDEGRGIAVDPAGNAYITGFTYSTNFPTANPLQANCDECNSNNSDAFVAKLNPAGGALVYSTYLGGGQVDWALGIAADATGNAYVTGFTQSGDFPSANALQPSYGGGGSDAFVAKLNPTGSALVYSTFLGGGNQDEGNGIAVDPGGNAYVTGWTESTNFPIANPLQPTYGGGNSDAFVAKLNATGSALVYSTYLGGSSNDEASGIFVDAAGNAYVTGNTLSTNFPTANPFQPHNGGGQDAFVTKVNPAGSALIYSSYLGGSGADTGSGIAADAAGHAYVTGNTLSTDFPTANPLQANCDNCGSGGDAFVVKLSPVLAVTLSANSLSLGSQLVGTTSAEQSVTLSNSGDASLAITGIATSGDFAQTNTCGNSVTAGANCTISVTFTPSASGARGGTLTISDNAANSPQTIALSGTGEDFTFTASSGSSTSATVPPGQSATYTLSVGGEGGLNQSVSFTCTGAPSEAACTVSPNPVTVGSSATNVTVTVATTAASMSLPRFRPLPPMPPLLPVQSNLVMLAALLAVLAWAVRHWRQPGGRRRRAALVRMAAALLLALGLASCGGGSGGGGGGGSTNPGTPAGTYNLTATGTVGSGSSSLSHSVTLTLNVT